MTKTSLNTRKHNDDVNAVTKTTLQQIIMRPRCCCSGTHVGMMVYIYGAVPSTRSLTVDRHAFNGLFSRITWVSRHRKG